jgi:hypothetical protein
MKVIDKPHARTTLTSGKMSRFPLYRRLGEPQTQHGSFGEEKPFLSLPGFEIPTFFFVAYLLYQLNSSGYSLSFSAEIQKAWIFPCSPGTYSWYGI